MMDSKCKPGDLAMVTHVEPVDGNETNLSRLPAALVADGPWQVVMNALRVEDEPEAVLDQVAHDGLVPPEGAVTRGLLIAWTSSRPLGGGLLKTGDATGFRAGGRFEEPFLSVVLGRGHRKARVLEDIKLSTPQMYPVLIEKLDAVARFAKSTRSRIEYMGAAPIAKAMLNALYLYGESLTTGVEDE